MNVVTLLLIVLVVLVIAGLPWGGLLVVGGDWLDVLGAEPGGAVAGPLDAGPLLEFVCAEDGLAVAGADVGEALARGEREADGVSHATARLRPLGRGLI